VASVVVLVDAVNAHATFEQHDEAVRQVALADQILITKLDLVAEEAQAGREAVLRTLLQRLNPAARIRRIDDPSIAIGGLLTSRGFDPADSTADPRAWLNEKAYTQPSSADDHDHDHDHCDDPTHDHSYGHHHGLHLRRNGIESFCLIRNEPLTRGALQFLLDGISQNLGPGLLRVKGLVNVADEPGRPAVIQGAQHLLHTMTWLDKWPDSDQRTRVVFITQGVAQDALKDMIELLDRMAARTSKARQRADAIHK
jgi:G3E family GTPase